MTDLHLCGSATGKTYAYMVDVGATSDPFMIRYSQYVWRPVDVQAMRCACCISGITHPVTVAQYVESSTLQYSGSIIWHSGQLPCS